MAEIKNFFEDLSKLTTNAAAAVFESGQEFTGNFKEKLKPLLNSMNLVSREEFDIVKQLAEKNALENIELKKKLDDLLASKNN